MLNPERKRTDYLTPLSDKLEMIEQHDVDYCIVINFSSRFASVTREEFVQDYIINNRVKEVIVVLTLLTVNSEKVTCPY